MAYYFMAEVKKGTYQAISISDSKYFQNQIRKFKKPCAYTLQEIDLFTMMFDNEIELRERLVEEGVLSLKFFEKPLSIRLPKGNTYKKVQYDFLYQKDIEYILEPERIISLVMKKYYQNDFVFIKTLANHFSEVYECSTTAPEVARLSEASIYQGRRHSGLEEIDKNGDAMVARMLKLLIIKHYERPDGKIDYKDEINYRNLHDLIAFINNYNKKNNLIETQASPRKNEEKPTNNLAVKEQQPIKTTQKTRSRKKYNIEGQISFFDN